MSHLNLEWGSLELPLVRPLPVRGRAVSRRTVLYLRWRNAQGHEGWGEAAPLPGLHRDTPAQLQGLLARHARAWGQQLSLWLDSPQQPLPGWSPAAPACLECALDQAALGLWGDIHSQRPWQWLGAPRESTLHVAPLLDHAGLPARIPVQPAVYKIKLATESLVEQRLQLTRQLQRLELAPGSLLLRLDANCRLTEHHLPEIARWRDDLPVQWLEDPCASPALSRAFCDALNLPLALDEGLPLDADPAEQAAFIARHRPQAVILKPALAGGVNRLRQWHALCADARCSLVFSSCFESAWGLQQLAGWAAAIAARTAHGLGTHGWLAPEPGTPMQRMMTRWPLWHEPRRPVLAWQRVRSWFRSQKPLVLGQLPGLSGAVAGRGPAHALGLPLPSGFVTPPAGHRIACRWPAPGMLPQAPGQLLELLHAGCDVFPQDARQPLVQADARAHLAGCDLRIELEPGQWSPFEPGPARVPIPGPAPHLLVATGGSSGRTRIVCHGLRSLLASAAGANARMPFAPGDRWLLALPLHHVGGLALLFRALLGGGALVLPRTGESLAAAVIRTVPSHLSLVPTQLRQLLANPACVPALRAARLVLVGGAALPEELRRRSLALGVRVAPSWGLSESASQVCTAVPGTAPAGCDAGAGCGEPLPGRELRVRSGELQIRGSMLCEGWIEQGGFRRAPRSDAWFPTGDLGHVDRTGRLQVLGRRDRMLVSGGENLYPEMIESHLLAHPLVEEACVLGIRDEHWGQRPVAVLRLKSGVTELPADWRIWLNSQLARPAQPDAWYRWPEGPVALKTRWGELERRLARGELDRWLSPGVR